MQFCCFVQYAHRLEREGKLEAAAACYREALADDPEQEAARTRLNIIVTALEKQVQTELKFLVDSLTW